MSDFTAENVAEMKAAYVAATSDAARQAVVEAYADSIGRSVPSIRMKLVSEGVYQRPARTAKNGKPVVQKNALVDQINEQMGDFLTEAEADSLTKASKGALEKILVIMKGLREDLEEFLDEDTEEDGEASE